MKATEREIDLANEVEQFFVEQMAGEPFSSERVLVLLLARLFTIEDESLHVKGDEFGRDLQETMEGINQ